MVKGGDDENDSVIKEIRKNKNTKKNTSNISKSITGILKKKDWASFIKRAYQYLRLNIIAPN